MEIDELNLLSLLDNKFEDKSVEQMDENEPEGKVNGFSKGWVNNHFDNNLIGVVYKKLGWERQGNYYE